MIAVTDARNSFGMRALQFILPRCVESPTNSCGTPLAARVNCAFSDSVNGRQLTMSL